METGHRPHLPQSAHEAITTASFADFASACLDQIVVAVKDDRVLGFIATEQADNFITDLWIDPDCESSGLGTALVEEAERRIAARGYHTAEISVLLQNERALGLYHHMKYEDVHEAPGSTKPCNAKSNTSAYANTSHSSPTRLPEVSSSGPPFSRSAYHLL